jgi:hypothetical protein
MANRKAKANGGASKAKPKTARQNAKIKRK